MHLITRSEHEKTKYNLVSYRNRELLLDEMNEVARILGIKKTSNFRDLWINAVNKYNISNQKKYPKR